MEEIPRACEPLLYKIARSFGLSNSESQDLIQQVYSYALKDYLTNENHHPLRIRLVKMVVHKCIFIISSRLFNQFDSCTGKNNAESLSYYYAYLSAQRSKSGDMPLSFRVVFILKNMGFNENEIAAILNTTTIKVKERFGKALAYRYGWRNK
jgi:DNA-directed RNA polymerase specialized sigma24 family protein